MSEKEYIAQLEAALRPFALFSALSTGEAEYGDDVTEDRILTRKDFDRAWETLINKPALTS